MDQELADTSEGTVVTREPWRSRGFLVGLCGARRAVVAPPRQRPRAAM